MTGKYVAPPAELKELAPGVYAFLQPAFMFQSNSGLIVGENWATVFDSQTNKYQIENFISKIKKVTDKPIRFLVNSHYDPDHTFTNHFFNNATAIATEATRRLTMGLHPYSRIALPKMLPEPLMSFEGIKMTPQDMVYEGMLKLYDGKREIQIIDMGAAHTESDAIIYLPEEKVVFCGDLVCSGMEAVTGGAEGVTGTEKGSFHIIEVLEKLSNFNAEQFVPGHGNVIFSREQVVEFTINTTEFLLVVREEARKCFCQGMSYKEAADRLDYRKLEKWGTKDKLYPVMYGNCFRVWKEFNGELPLGSGMDLEETMAKAKRNPDGTYPERIDLGYSRPWEPW
jgi:cyclase